MNTTRIKMLALLAPLSIFAVAGMTGCEEDDTTFEDLGEDIDETMDEAEDDLDDLGDEIEDEFEDVDDDLDDDTLDDIDGA